MEFKGYSTLWKAIIRPPRFEYDPKDMGPDEFYMSKMRIKRTDIELKNQFGFTLKCSHYEPHESHRQWNELPCVIYLHGNSSSRLEALEAVPYLLPSNITLFCFDFAGCGLSEGEYISLGWYERDDLGLIVEYLRKERRVSTIGLWGRSMGAVTSLLHGDRDPSIAAMVLDSPFSNMKQLVGELAKFYTKIPSLLVSAALKMVRSTIKSKAHFDIYDLSPIDHVKECFIPALFAAATEDDFIQPHHADDLFKAYAGDKNIVKFDGDHNSPRPKFFHDSVVIFFHNTLQVDALLTEQTKIKKKPDQVDNNNIEDFGDLDVDDMDIFSQQMLYQQLQQQNPLGIYPNNENQLKNAGFQMQQNPRINGDSDALDEDPGDGIDPDDFAGLSEEEIMRRVMEESMKSAKDEEEKRQGNKEDKKETKSQSEEDYILQCMEKVGIEESKQSEDLQQNNGNPKTKSEAPVKSIDDLLNM